MTTRSAASSPGASELAARLHSNDALGGQSGLRNPLNEERVERQRGGALGVDRQAAAPRRQGGPPAVQPLVPQSSPLLRHPPRQRRDRPGHREEARRPRQRRRPPDLLPPRHRRPARRRRGDSVDNEPVMSANKACEGACMALASGEGIEQDHCLAWRNVGLRV